MATITEDYVSFETAKLLKEKGFDWEFHKHYWGYKPSKEFLTSECFNSEYDYPAPTLQMAIKWLREVHKLHIWVDYSSFDFNDKFPYLWNIRETKIEGTYWGGTYHKSCEQACEEAIRYCLNNLI